MLWVALIFLACLAAWLWLCARAPYGFEGPDGWHPGIPPDDVAADATARRLPANRSLHNAGDTA